MKAKRAVEMRVSCGQKWGGEQPTKMRSGDRVAELLQAAFAKLVKLVAMRETAVRRSVSCRSFPSKRIRAHYMSRGEMGGGP